MLPAYGSNRPVIALPLMQRVLIVTADTGLTARLGALLGPHVAVASMEPKLPSLPQALAQLAPDLLALDADPVTGLGAGYAECAAALRGAPFVTIGDDSNAALAIAAIRAGSLDYIGTFSPDAEIGAQISRALQHAQTKPPPPTGGRLSLILSGRPHESADLFAVNLAVAIAKRASGDTVFVDCTLPVSNAGIALNLAPRYLLRDALADITRMDRALLTEALARHTSSGLYLLPMSLTVESVRDIAAANLLALIGALRAAFAEVVLDVGGFRHSPLLGRLCGAATASYVYATQSLSSVRACQGMLTAAGLSARERERAALIVGDYQADIALTSTQIAATLGVARLTRLPAARAALINSFNAGQPIAEAEPDSPYALALAEAIGLFPSGPEPR
jgi:Flp pilus assembly CpaE family ATPase